VTLPIALEIAGRILSIGAHAGAEASVSACAFICLSIQSAADQGGGRSKPGRHHDPHHIRVMPADHEGAQLVGAEKRQRVSVFRDFGQIRYIHAKGLALAAHGDAGGGIPIAVFNQTVVGRKLGDCGQAEAATMAGQGR